MKKLITIILVAVLMISFAVVANAAVGTVVYGTKVKKAPNLEEIDKSWGEPAIVINSSSANCYLYKNWNGNNPGDTMSRNIDPENNDVSLYYLWDDKNFYFGMLTADTEASGNTSKWKGDGVQMWFQALDVVRSTTSGVQAMDTTKYPGIEATYNELAFLCDYYCTLDFDDESTTYGGAANGCECVVYHDGEYLHAIIAVPWVNMGINPKKMNLHGMEFGTAFLRISSRSDLDEGFAGWLVWGKYFAETPINSLNTVILVDPDQGSVTASTQAPATEPVVQTEAPVAQTEPPIVQTAAQTQAPETQAPETEAPVIETEAPETEAPVVETEDPVVETEAPVMETEAPETEAPAIETEAPEVEEKDSERNRIVKLIATVGGIALLIIALIIFAVIFVIVIIIVIIVKLVKKSKKGKK